ncbi:hypothetical protein CW751_06255 [Brumimicrobium salinarum]|uniref:PEGA domain-containing protein n=1 Tax=Brumimicrobium salinarum TaxID=2058658 RepID=A0A2I0R3M9_9FLAO|nr:trypsin-like peptidase domain-containing protein [Brumimicrobium salinarum]PKR81184.1 hypothetical protein CW751_06255 [Brumimicrobium salinarum]
MKTLLPALLLSSLILFQSCATILGTKKQTVELRTEDETAEVYTADTLLAAGASTNLSLEKSFDTKQVIVKKDGFEDKYYCVVASKRSPLYFLSWFPFVVVLAPFYDYGIKSYKYDFKSRALAPSTQKSKYRSDDDKYILVNDVSINLTKDSLSETIQLLNSYKRFGYQLREKRYDVNEHHGIILDDDIEVSNTVFSTILNEYLKDRNFTDSTKNILNNNTNTLYLDAEINSLSLTRIVYSTNTPRFFIGDIGITWTVKDIYKKELFSFTDEVRTDEIANPFVDDDKKNYFFRNALSKSLINLLETEDYFNVSKIIVESEEKEAFFVSKPAQLIDNNIGNALKATVTVKTKDGHGSGFFINNEGYLLTNYHVVAGVEKEDLTVILNNGEEHQAKVIRQSEFDDLALLKIEHQNTYSFNLEGEQTGSIGDEIFAIGTPNAIELGQSLSKGIISGKRKNDNEQTYFQTDASVNHGNSGGALVLKSGELIGIVNAKLVGIGIEGIGFAIEIKRAVKSLNLKYN